MRHVLAAALLLLAAPASAATIVLDFEEEALGTSSGFISAECGCVTFSEESGAFGELRVFDYFLGSRSIAVGEEGGALIMEFSVPVFSLSIDFGNDSASPEVSASPARLYGYAGGIEVAFAELAANQNRLVDQTLTITSAVPLERAFFTFRQLGEHEPISPVVDNIVLTTVPEPGTLGLLALAAAPVWWLQRGYRIAECCTGAPSAARATRCRCSTSLVGAAGLEPATPL